MDTFAPRPTPRGKICHWITSNPIIGFEVIHISIKKMLHVSSTQNGAHF